MLLPLPEGPTMATLSPAWISNVTSSRASSLRRCTLGVLASWEPLPAREGRYLKDTWSSLIGPRRGAQGGVVIRGFKSCGVSETDCAPGRASGCAWVPACRRCAPGCPLGSPSSSSTLSSAGCPCFTSL